MDDQMESSVPPGFRFHPTEEELVGYYLKRKTHSLKIDLDAIVDIDLYKMEPWDIQERCKVGYYEQSEWYFFNHKDRKYPTGTRTNRATAAGFWKATGRDKAVLSKNRIIGMRKTLVFYNGRAPNGRKSDWIMHEYRLQTSEHGPPQEEGWVVCRAFKKPTPNQRPQGYQGWNINHVYNMNHHPNHSCSHQNTTTQHSYMHQQQIVTSPPDSNFQHHHPLMSSVVLASASLSAPDHHDNNYQLNLLRDQLPQLLDSPPTLSPTNNFPTKVDHVDQANTSSTIDWTSLDGLLGPQVNDTTITTTTTSSSSVFANDNFSIPSIPENYLLQQVDVGMDGSTHDHGINSISHFLGCFPDL